MLRRIGETSQLAVVATLTNGVQERPTAAVSWSSSNPGVAIVSNAGMVTAVAEGLADIRATYQGTSLLKAVRVDIPKPAEPSVTASVTVVPSTEPGFQWRASLQITYAERRGSSGFRVDSARLDYRDSTNQSRFVRELSLADFQLAWGSDRIEAGATQRIARRLDFTGSSSALTVNIVTSITDDMGNTTTHTVTASGEASSSARPALITIAGGVAEDVGQ